MPHVVVMGVTGCGKSTVGRLLADALCVPFLDGDDLHPPSNVAKMASGVPLTDEDRWPWLRDIAAWLSGREGGVVACSALRRSYRDAIRAEAPGAVFVCLSAPKEVLAPRVDDRHARDGHFSGSALLDSQFAILEPLEGDERGLAVDVIDALPTLACATALEWIEKAGAG
jgi:carbohydrate kinase (thermoresistant glucokinase family)